ncbi:ABC transporter ATP-binding protein [Pedobacter punctiformis]|uniref:ABC transporter ATP-binding protein n=1 Tax=Pedobacter punctiformis TaxID=3004097 RepID=A0ABT4L9V1_9SPHI|nr:ABC transporter ATP-binding protein [Pedobacter sp. HCMS5-2]MCZ4244696.1 ABC transporter ATP-binding protein [Pedobacter sp. HCMS5-2]
MSKIIIKAENLGKAYQIGQIGTGTISRDLERWYAKIRKKEDPFLKIGETNAQNIKSESDVVWSLKDINFEIEQGDAVGIIGRNGAGKSTLLKILSKVTAPTTGKITGKGRIASLLEVGTGFHPELSGRENIFLNGAILGMRKKEIQRKLDEIVDFAGIERYLDTPVKRYSSGMYVRLAFAVAAHLESEILIVDEVLAVGDAEFQKKCLGKMNEVSKSEGRTVLFVSHNMGSVRHLCDNGILLKNGKISSVGNIKEVTDSYLTQNIVDVSNSYSHKEGSRLVEIDNVKLEKIDKSFKIHEEIKLSISFNNKHIDKVTCCFFILIYNSEGECIAGSFQTDTDQKITLEKDKGSLTFSMPNYLYPGKYFISVGIFDDGGHFLDWVEYAEIFESSGLYMNNSLFKERLGITIPTSSWKYNG